MQRYDLERVGGQSYEPADRVMVARDDGDWIKYTDHAALLEQVTGVLEEEKQALEFTSYALQKPVSERTTATIECTSEEGVIVGLIDSVMTIAAVAVEKIEELQTDSWPDGVREALSDMFSSAALRRLISYGGHMVYGDEPSTEQLSRLLKDAIAALQWTEIAEDNLPRVGDEVFAESFPVGQQVCSVGAEDVREWNLAAMREDGWTHRRPINPPAPQRKDG